jgi:membrane protein implicated in regulation of membrane protease activity
MWIMMLIMGLPLIGLVVFRVLPWKTALPLYVVLLVASILYHRAMMKSQKLAVKTGPASMIGAIVTVISWRTGSGRIRYQGESWAARTANANEPMVPGSKVAIEAVKGLELVVRSVPDSQRTTAAEDTAPDRSRLRRSPPG